MLAVSSVLFGRKVGSFLPMGRLVVTVHLPSVKLIVMVKVISSLPPPVLAVRYGSPVAAAAGGKDAILMLVILVSLLSAVVSIGEGVGGAIKIVLDFFCRVCVTGLLECGLGCGYGLAYGSV